MLFDRLELVFLCSLYYSFITKLLTNYRRQNDVKSKQAGKTVNKYRKCHLMLTTEDSNLSKQKHLTLSEKHGKSCEASRDQLPPTEDQRQAVVGTRLWHSLSQPIRTRQRQYFHHRIYRNRIQFLAVIKNARTLVLSVPKYVMKL